MGAPSMNSASGLGGTGGPLGCGGNDGPGLGTGSELDPAPDPTELLGFALALLGAFLETAAGLAASATLSNPLGSSSAESLPGRAAFGFGGGGGGGKGFASTNSA